MPTVSYAGIYIVQWLDRFAISPSVLVVVLVETVTISWSYGLDKFCEHIKEMNGSYPFYNWKISWKYICPISLIIIIVMDIIFFETLTFGAYQFPHWSMWLGYLLNVIALLPIVVYPIYYRYYLKDSNKEKLTENF